MPPLCLSSVTHAASRFARFDLGLPAVLPLYSQMVACWLWKRASRQMTCSTNWQAYKSRHFLEQNPSALNQAQDWQMNVRNLILWLFVTVSVEVALEELNEGKNTGQLTSRCVCRRKTCFHPHPPTQCSGGHASTCTLTCSCHQPF